MKKAFRSLSISLVFLTSFFVFVKPAIAADSCEDPYNYSSTTFSQTQFYADNDYTPASVQITGLVPGKEYYLIGILDIGVGSTRNVFGTDSTIGKTSKVRATDSDGDGVGEATLTITNNDFFDLGFVTNVFDKLQSDTGNVNLILATDDRNIQRCRIDTPAGCVDRTPQLCNLYRYQILKPSLGVTCDGFIVKQQNNSGCFTPGSATWELTGLTNADGTQYRGNVEIQFPGGGIVGNDQEFNYTGGSKNGSFEITNNDVGKSLEVIVHTEGGKICSFNVSPIKAVCSEEEREREVDVTTGSADFNFELCLQIPAGPAQDECKNCWGKNGIWTAIGCISYNPTEMISTLMKVGLSISGGVALLMILAAGFMFSTSQGDPKKVSEAKELMTSAVIGLFFIIFSVTILQFIGVNLLKIPGFGG